MAKKTTKKSVRKKSVRKKTAGRLLEEKPVAQAPTHTIVSLDEILGQSRAIGLIDAALESGRVHHAWIFHGPEGVGKCTTALALAGVILDPTTAPDLAGHLRPDPQSPTQHQLRAGTHPDLHVIHKGLALASRDPNVRSSKQTSIAKEVVEEFLIEPASRTSVSSSTSIANKVFIVDEAHLLGMEAQNALLKTLEEPPTGTILILITPSEDRLLPTIRSRCQRVPFGPLADEAMQAWLMRSQLDLSDIDRTWALAFAGGSPGILTAIAKTGMGNWHQALAQPLAALARGQSVIELGSLLATLVDQAAAQEVAGNPHASKDVANRTAARRMFQMLGESFRAHLKNATFEQDHDHAEWAIACIDLVNQAQAQLDANVALSLLFENFAAQCPVAS